MAHRTRATPEGDAEYRLLRERLDRNVTGAADSAAVRRVLQLLFTPRDAHVVRQMPTIVSLPDLADRLDCPLQELDEHITDMAQRGLVLDFEGNGVRHALPSPVVIGFYEYTFMRVRPDGPMEEIAGAFEELFDDEEAVRGCSGARPRSDAPWYGRRHCRTTRRPRSWTGSGRRRSSGRPIGSPLLSAPAATMLGTSARPATPRCARA
jgi:hypothetical protein